MNDLMKIFLQAEVNNNSINTIHGQIKKIQQDAKPIKINVDIDSKSTVSNMSQISRAVDDASKMEREYGRAIKMRGDEAHAAALKINNAMEAEKRTTQALKEQIELFKRRQEIQAKNIETKYKDTYNVEALTRFRTELQTLDATNPRVQSQMRSMAVGLREIGAEARNGQLGIQSLGQSVLGTVQKFAMFAGINLSIYGLFREIKKGVKDVMEMDSALTEIGIVLGKTQSQISGLAQEYGKLGREMKVTANEIAQAAVTFTRQGLSEAESFERLDTAIKYAKISNADFTESANILTATVNSMNIDIDRTADVFSKVGDAAATSSLDIGVSMAKAGGAAGSLGVEFEKVVSWIATIKSKTQQSSESIGTAISSILSRMSQMKKKGFDEEDGTQINDVAKALSAVGIELMNSKGEFNDFGNVLDVAGSKWHTYNDKQKAFIATTLGGRTNMSNFLALMNDYSTSLDLYSVAMDSAGATNEKYNIYLQSTAAAMEELKNEAQIFWMNLINSESIKSFLNTVTGFIKTIDLWVEKFGSMGAILSVVTPMIGIKLVGAIKAGSFALDILLTKATLATAGLALIPIAIGLWINAERKRQELMDKAVDSSETLSNEVSSLEALSNKYKELSKVENKSVEQKEELLKIQKELAQMYPELATGLDSEGNKIAESIKLTDSLTKSKKDLLEAELLAIKTMANNELPKLQSELDKTQKMKNELITKLESGDTKTEGYDEYGFWTQIDESAKLATQLQKLVEKEKELTEQIDKYKGSLEGYNKLVAERKEAEKWIIAAEIEKQAQTEKSLDQIQQMESRLKSLGFTSDDVYKIMSGNLAEVKDRYNILTEAQIENYKSVTELDTAAHQYAINRLKNDKELTISLINNTKSRISAMQAEAKAMAALTGGKVKASVISKMPTSDDMFNSYKERGVLGAIDTAAQANSIAAQKELIKLESSLKNIDAALANVSSIKPSSSSIDGAKYKGKDPKKDKKKKEDYKAEADAYAEINLSLERNSTLLALNKIQQEAAGDDLSKKIPLMEKEIELSKQRQALQHKLNTQQRQERANLEKSLSKQGFKFDGEGDTRMITNLEKIEGKSKEVEEQFNRYIALQKTEIPKASQEWANLQISIDKVRLDKLIAQFKLADKGFEDINKSISNLAYELKMLDPDDFSGKVDNSMATLDELGKSVEDTTRLLSELGENGYKVGTKESDAFIARQVELTARLKDGALAAKEQERALADMVKQQREKVRTEWIKKQNEALAEQRTRLQALESIQEAIVAIIRKRGEAEKKALDDAHKSEMDSLDKRHNERKKKYQEETDLFKKMIQDKIDALEEQYNEEDYLEELSKERDKANELQKQIDVLSLDDSLTARNKTIDLRKQLADQNERIAKMQQKKERDLLKQSLQDQLKNRETDAKEKDDIADRTYENEKKRLEEDYQISKDFLERKYSDERVYAEARESIMRGTVETSRGMFEDIYDAYQDFENKFGKGMGILGDIIKTDFLDQLDKAQQAIRDLEYNSRARDDYRSDYDPGDRELGWSDPRDDYRPSSGGGSSRNPNYGVGKATGQAARDNEAKLKEDQRYRESEIRRAREVIADRKSAGMSVKDQEAYLKRLMSGSYDNGGKITKTGFTLNQFHGTESSPEWIFNDSQLKSIIKDVTTSAMKVTLPKLPNIDSMGSTGGNTYDIKFDIKGNMDRSILPEVQRMITTTIEKTQAKKISNFKDVGIRRPV